MISRCSRQALSTFRYQRLTTTTDEHGLYCRTERREQPQRSTPQCRPPAGPARVAAFAAATDQTGAASYGISTANACRPRSMPNEKKRGCGFDARND
jgi:hypothetical protein